MTQVPSRSPFAVGARGVGETPVLVSVLSPVMNEAEHIGEMVESVLRQTHSAFELIIVDDGSLDETLAIVRVYEERDPRIRVFDEGKLGKVAAFNRAFGVSRGQLIVLLGGDDILPMNSLEARVLAAERGRKDRSSRIAVFARLKTFSKEPRFDSLTIPRSTRRGGRSGGTLAMTRDLAQRVFPIPTSLVAEDIWLSCAAEAMAERVYESSQVVLNYRIHAGNSNPRGKPFAVMTEEMHQRMLAYSCLAQMESDVIDGSALRRFRASAALEEQRYRGSVLGVIASRGTSIGDRIRALSMTTPRLFRVRNAFFRFFSGW